MHVNAQQKHSFFYTAFLFIRSLLFSTSMLIVTVIQSFFCLLCSPFPLKYRYAIIANYNRMILWLLKMICGVKYKIEGLENIPKDYNGIILSKHQSTWETLILPTIFYQPAIILKKELFWVPFFGWGLATIDPIAIDRSNAASAMDQIIKKGKLCLEDGRWILVFPEGTRIPFGKVGKYHLGGARLAVATDRKVIPVAHNAGVFWPRRKFIKQPGTVHVVIGEMIETKDRRPEDIMEEVKNWIEGTIVRINAS